MSNTSWDLSPFFKSEEEFLAALEEFKKIPPIIASYAGTLSDEEKLKEYFRLNKRMNKDLARLYYFASMRSDLDNPLKDLFTGYVDFGCGWGDARPIIFSDPS